MLTKPLFTKRLSSLRAVSALALVIFAGTSLPAAADNAEQALALLDKTDKLYRLDSSYSKMTMEIETPNWQRTLQMESWSKGMDYSLIRILSPRKEKGVSTLKRDNEMWNFFPRINKVVKVPPSMMMGSWMGSDFTNDDLVREVSLVEEYDIDYSQTDTLHQLVLLPKAQTVTVWGKIEVDIDKQNELPVEQRFYDEDGTQMRVMRFNDVRDFDGFLLPAEMELIPLSPSKKGNRTVVRYDELKLNTPVDDDMFTLRSLKARRR